jgi:hypothetical protein
MGALGGDAADREAKLHQIEKLASSAALQGSESLCNLLRHKPAGCDRKLLNITPMTACPTLLWSKFLAAHIK